MSPGEIRLSLEASKRRSLDPLFDLAFASSVAGLDDMEVNESTAATLKGGTGLRTCTFSCVYCPNELDETGEQINPKIDHMLKNAESAQIL